MPPIALTIAGSDPSGGAGIQADLKTFHQFGVYGEAVIALLTVQNTVRVSRVVVMPPALVLAQLAAVLEDIPPGAAKTGALGSTEMVELAVGNHAENHRVLHIDVASEGARQENLVDMIDAHLVHQQLGTRVAGRLRKLDCADVAWNDFHDTVRASMKDVLHVAASGNEMG